MKSLPHPMTFFRKPGGRILLLLSLLLIPSGVHAESAEEDLVRLKLIRYEALRSALQDTIKKAANTVLTDLEPFIREAVRDSDWISAEILLDEVLARLEEPVPDETAAAIPAAIPETASRRLTRSWESGVTAGAEYAEYDSAGTPVPYAQVRSVWKTPLLNWQAELAGEARYYYNDRMSLAGYTGLTKYTGPWSVLLDNEVTRETNADSAVQPYLENILTADAGYRFNALFRSGSALEAAVRVHDEEDSTDYDYLTLRHRAWLRFDDRNGLSIDAEAGWGYRGTRLDTAGDYREVTGALMIDRYFGWTNRVLVGSDHSLRDYFVPDDTSSYANDYTEHRIYGEVQFGITDNIRLKTAVERGQRTYRLPATYAPDAQTGLIVPGIAWDILDNLTLGLDVSWESALHTAADSVGTAADYAAGEDYTATALELSADFFIADRLFLSLADEYEIKTYSNPEKSDINQDSRTNSLILFLTWKITPHFELSISTFQDNEDAMAAGDLEASSSELLNYTAELTYSF